MLNLKSGNLCAGELFEPSLCGGGGEGEGRGGEDERLEKQHSSRKFEHGYV